MPVLNQERRPASRAARPARAAWAPFPGRAQCRPQLAPRRRAGSDAGRTRRGSTAANDPPRNGRPHPSASSVGRATARPPQAAIRRCCLTRPSALPSWPLIRWRRLCGLYPSLRNDPSCPSSRHRCPWKIRGGRRSRGGSLRRRRRSGAWAWLSGMTEPVRQERVPQRGRRPPGPCPRDAPDRPSQASTRHHRQPVNPKLTRGLKR